MLLPLLRHFPFPFFLAVTAVLFGACDGTTRLCKGDACTLLSPSESFVRVEAGDERPRWHRFDGRGLTALDGMYPGSTPLSYHAGLDLLAAKSLSGDGMRLSLYRGGSGMLKEAVTRNYRDTDQISALCMTDDGTIWLLHQGRYDDQTPRHILSRGDTALTAWENYFLTSDSLADTFGGSAIERPVSIFCGAGGEDIFVTTFLYSGEAEQRLLRLPRLSLLQVYLYRFDPRERVMHPVAGFTPRGNGPVRAHFDAAADRLIVFQDGRVFQQTGLGFPEELLYPGSEEALFGPDGNATTIFLIGKDHAGITGRVERL